jgi:hypothetical protein
LFGVAGCGPFGGGSGGQTPGTIVFGSGAHRVSAYQWTINKPRTAFRDGGSIGWVAQLKEPLGSATVTILLKNARNGRTIWQGQRSGLNPKFVELANNSPVDAFVKVGTDGSLPGRYTLEYLEGSQVLAQGTFRITK